MVDADNDIMVKHKKVLVHEFMTEVVDMVYEEVNKCIYVFCSDGMYIVIQNVYDFIPIEFILPLMVNGYVREAMHELNKLIPDCLLKIVQSYFPRDT